MENRRKCIYAAADIGTTSIVVSCSDEDGRELFRRSAVNPGRKFGADVISRISYVSAHPEAVGIIGAAMRKTVSDELAAGCEGIGVPFDSVGMMTVVGNPAMELLFTDVSPEPIGTYPYTLPHAYGRYADGLFGFPTYMAGLLSGYIGGDALFGAAHVLYGRESGEPVICADLGTNCETWCCDGKNLTFVSSAAGPAFEGAHIECGMGAVDGAVKGIADGEKGPEPVIIGNGAAKGFCGSGIISAAAYMLEKGIIGSDGKINRSAPGVTETEGAVRYEFGGGLYLTQKDIRQIQTAKAAVAAGIGVISEAVGTDRCEIILTGAFGDSIDCRAAEKIGLVPHGRRFSSVGNAALEGARRFSCDSGFRRFVSGLSEKSRCLDLSMDDKFSALFINKMNF